MLMSSYHGDEHSGQHPQPNTRDRTELKALKIPENKRVVKNQHKDDVEGSKEKRVRCECEYRNCPNIKTLNFCFL